MCADDVLCRLALCPPRAHLCGDADCQLTVAVSARHQSNYAARCADGLIASISKPRSTYSPSRPPVSKAIVPLQAEVQRRVAWFRDVPCEYGRARLRLAFPFRCSIPAASAPLAARNDLFPGFPFDPLPNQAVSRRVQNALSASSRARRAKCTRSPSCSPARSRSTAPRCPRCRYGGRRLRRICPRDHRT